MNCAKSWGLQIPRAQSSIQVRNICEILAGLSLDIASFDEVYAPLDLKGDDDLNFKCLVRKNDC